MADGSGDTLVAALARPNPTPGSRDRPLIVLIHGLGGSDASTYMLRTAQHWLQKGHGVLRLNLRGAGDSGPRCRFSYHAGRTQDLHCVLRQLEAHHRNLLHAGIGLVGYSLGGNMLLKFLAEHGEAFPIAWAASVSAPIDLAAASKRFCALRNRPYQNHILAALKQDSLRDEAKLSPQERRVVEDARSVFDFDDRFVAPRNDYEDAAQYYACNSARDFLHAVTKPTLVIYAQNDPWIPASSYLEFAWHQSPNLVPLFPKSGGHVGFHDRGHRSPWHDRCIEQFAAAVGKAPEQRAYAR